MSFKKRKHNVSAGIGKLVGIGITRAIREHKKALILGGEKQRGQKNQDRSQCSIN